MLQGQYTLEELTIPARKVNVKGFYMMLPLVAITFIPYYLLWQTSLTFEALKNFASDSKVWGGYGSLLIVFTMIIGIVLHELIHGITWAMLVPGGLKKIKFGIIWSELIPYCHCTEEMPVRHYRIGTLMPGLILGIVPTIIGYISGNFWFAIFGSFFTAAAAGDLMILNLLQKESNDTLVKDHPEKVGCIVYRKAPENQEL